MHASCVSYERMYSTGSGTYGNVSTHPLNITDWMSIREGSWSGKVKQHVLNCIGIVVTSEHFEG